MSENKTEYEHAKEWNQLFCAVVFLLFVAVDDGCGSCLLGFILKNTDSGTAD